MADKDSKEEENDKGLFFSMERFFSYDEMKEFIKSILSAGSWDYDTQNRMLSFEEYLTDSPSVFFFDESLEEKRKKLAKTYSQFLTELCEHAGPFCGRFSLRDECNNEERVERLNKRIEIMEPISHKVLDEYRSLVLYARKERKFL